MFAFQYENNLLAECVTGFFIKNSKIHSYETRQADKMHVPKLQLRKLCVIDMSKFGIMSAQ